MNSIMKHSDLIKAKQSDLNQTEQKPKKKVRFNIPDTNSMSWLERHFRVLKYQQIIDNSIIPEPKNINRYGKLQRCFDLKTKKMMSIIQAMEKAKKETRKYLWDQKEQKLVYTGTAEDEEFLNQKVFLDTHTLEIINYSSVLAERYTENEDEKFKRIYMFHEYLNKKIDRNIFYWNNKRKCLEYVYFNSKKHCHETLIDAVHDAFKDQNNWIYNPILKDLFLRQFV